MSDAGETGDSDIVPGLLEQMTFFGGRGEGEGKCWGNANRRRQESGWVGHRGAVNGVGWGVSPKAQAQVLRLSEAGNRKPSKALEQVSTR